MLERPWPDRKYLHQGGLTELGRGCTMLLMPIASADSNGLCDGNGVDREQIREMLRLTPEERLQRVQEFVESFLEIRELNEKRAVR